MTAEIVIMNKEAVALAADSAVTVSGRGAQKIWNTANKVFTLSKVEPVGVMVYGNAMFCDVPWETIIKWYREDLHDRSFPTLQDYFDDFSSFMEQNTELFPHSSRIAAMTFEVLMLLDTIRETVDTKVHERLEGKQELAHGDIERIVIEALDFWEGEFSQEPTALQIPQDELAKVVSSIVDQEAKLKEQAFEDLPLPHDFSARLAKLVESLLTRRTFPSWLSGVVIAGFGRHDVFPRVREFKPHLFAGKYLKKQVGYKADITGHNRGVIKAFAQSDMVRQFMEGIDPQMLRFINDYFRELLTAIPGVLLESLSRDAIKTDELARRLSGAMDGLMEQFSVALEKQRQSQFIQPIVETVEALPKDELAAMAETLVNLVSFKRRMSQDAETVGGPVDVAVISKGDGLVWVKRKHYFDAKLNQHFFANYHRDRRQNDARNES